MPKSNLLSNNFLPLHRNWRKAGGMADFTLPQIVFHTPPTPSILEGEFRHQIVDALIVQRIERGFPKPKIWVRFPVGVRFTSANKQYINLLADFYFSKSPYISPYKNRIKSLTPSRLHTLTFFNCTAQIEL